MGDHTRGNIPQNSPKMGVNGQFQTKTAKYKNHNISKTIIRIKTKFNSRAVDIIRTAYYIHGPKLMKLIVAVLCVS